MYKDSSVRLTVCFSSETTVQQEDVFKVLKEKESQPKILKKEKKLRHSQINKLRGFITSKSTLHEIRKEPLKVEQKDTGH